MSQTAGARSDPARSRELDFLRGIAITLVMSRHLWQEPERFPPWLARLLAVWAQGGWWGVDLFFVLSGFLVSGLLMREFQAHGEIRPGRFLLRRGLRIWPGFYLFLTVILIASWPEKIHWDRVTAEAVYLQNYLPGLRGHTWTLAVEEHFYLLLAGACWWWTRKPLSGPNPFEPLPGWFLLVAVSCLLLRVLTNWSGHPGWYLSATHLRIDSLSFGVLLAYWHSFHHDQLRERFNRWKPVLLGPVVLGSSLPYLLDIETSYFMKTVGLTVLYLSCGYWLLLLVMRPISSRGLVSRVVKAVAVVGRHSYSIYLWHLEILYFVMEHARADRKWPLVGCWFLYLGGSIAFGSGVSVLIERQVLAWRDNRFPSRSGPLAAPGIRAD